LPARSLRQIGDDLDTLGPILLGDLVFRHVGLHGSQIELMSRAQRDEGAGAFSQPRVGIADQRGREHRRVLEQQVLDLDDRHVLAAADDDVLDAAVDADVALVVQIGEVAGVEPPAGVERLDVASLVVAERHLRATHHQQARFARHGGTLIRPDDLDLDALEGAPVGL